MSDRAAYSSTPTARSAELLYPRHGGQRELDAGLSRVGRQVEKTAPRQVGQSPVLIPRATCRCHRNREISGL